MGAGREEIAVWGEANFPEGDHEALERFRVESEGEELGSEGTALSCARSAADDLRREVVTPNVELGGLSLV